MKHIPRKRFGQHFLTDGGLIADIVHRIAPTPSDRVVEIGPGLGALTQPLLERCGHLTVVELDRDLIAYWQQRKGVSVVASDVLKVDFAQIYAGKLGLDFDAKSGIQAADAAQAAINNEANASPQTQKLRMVGNLPYNISSPILFHLLPYAHLVQDQHFMLQKEVIERMVAQPATAAYGRLSVMLQWRYEMDNFLFVPPEAFDPPPRVDSAVVSMIPRAAPAALQPPLLEELVRVAFSQRRKILRNTLGRWLQDKGFSGDFDVQRRAEEVPVAEYINLAQTLSPCA
jgi:16S rRNA (adenine1518-N6/adenine1519-N6)-dimethyltransferase